MAPPATEQKQSSIIIDCPAKKVHTLSMLDWSLLHDELLHLISTHLKSCFDVVHARSVCRSWRSSFSFPSCLLSPSYSLLMLDENEQLCTLKKVTLFLFRVLTPPVRTAWLLSEYFLGGIRQEDHMEFVSSPLQCSLKVKIPRFDPTLMNILECQIFPLGHQYRMIGWNPKGCTSAYEDMDFLSLNKEGEFVVLVKNINKLFVLRSAEMRWTLFKKISPASCRDLVSFRGRFYAVFLNEDTFVIDPYSLDATPLIPPHNSTAACWYLVESGNDELFLVEKIFPTSGVPLPNRCTCKVSKINEEDDKWVVVKNLGDRVLFN